MDYLAMLCCFASGFVLGLLWLWQSKAVNGQILVLYADMVRPNSRSVIRRKRFELFLPHQCTLLDISKALNETVDERYPGWSVNNWEVLESI